MLFYIYMLSFHSSDKVYIGCTTDVGKRFGEHLCSEQWYDLFVAPSNIKVLEIVNSSIKAKEAESSWIKLTWDINYNEMLSGYSNKHILIIRLPSGYDKPVYTVDELNKIKGLSNEDSRSYKVYT